MEEIRIFVIFFNFLSWENVVRLQTNNTKDCELRMVNKWMKHNQLSVMQDSEWHASQEKDQDCPTQPLKVWQQTLDLKEVKQLLYRKMELLYTQLSTHPPIFSS